jgi:probable rRNA maturation factor
LIQIELQNLQRKISLNLKKIKKAIEKVLKAEGKPDIHLTVSFVDNKKIRELNFRYRKVDSPTDVLSFDYSQSMDVAAGLVPASSVATTRVAATDGEIIISPQIINSNAKRFRTSQESEMYLCLVHGILHLLGYDDQSPKNRRLMKRREREILTEIRSLHRDSVSAPRFGLGHYKNEVSQKDSAD